MKSKDVRDAVRDAYGRIAEESASGSSCGCGPSCCGGDSADAFARGLGYDERISPRCPRAPTWGSPAATRPPSPRSRRARSCSTWAAAAGSTCSSPRRKVGRAGPRHRRGHDAGDARARPGATATFRERTRLDNVEFRLGEIEHLPVADASVDVVISNCVINLSPDKPQVWREIARVLKPGGRVAVSDMALLRPLPEAVREEILAYVGCVAGAVLIEEYAGHLARPGSPTSRWSPSPGRTFSTACRIRSTVWSRTSHPRVPSRRTTS